MAGVGNLAQASGYAPKMEAVNSGIAQIITHTGDQLVKTIDEYNQRHEAQKKAMNKAQLADFEYIDKIGAIDKSKLLPQHADTIDTGIKLATTKYKDAYQRNDNKAKAEAHNELLHYIDEYNAGKEVHDAVVNATAEADKIKQSGGVVDEYNNYLYPNPTTTKEYSINQFGQEPLRIGEIPTDENTQNQGNNQIQENTITTPQEQLLSLSPLEIRRRIMSEGERSGVTGNSLEAILKAKLKQPEKPLNFDASMEEVMGKDVYAPNNLAKIKETEKGVQYVEPNNDLADLYKKQRKAFVLSNLEGMPHGNHYDDKMLDKGYQMALQSGKKGQEALDYAKDFAFHMIDKEVEKRKEIAVENAKHNLNSKVNNEGGGSKDKSIIISEAKPANKSTPHFNTLRDNAYNIVKEPDVAKFLKEKGYNAKTKGGLDWVTNIDDAIKRSANKPNIQKKLIEAKDANETAMLMDENGLRHSGYYNDIKTAGRKNNYTVLGLGRVEGTLTGVQSYTDDNGNIKQALLIDIPIKDGGGKTKTHLALLDDATNKLAFDNDTKGKGEHYLEDNDKKTKELLSSQGKKEGVKPTKFKDDDIVKITINGKTYTQTAKALKDKGYNESQFTK